MVELRELLTGASTSVPLDVAALQIGTIDDPNADIESALLLLDSHAAEFGERVTRRTSGQEFVTGFNEYLFEELGFQGNSINYYDPDNSCLQQVLLRRLGIPITLSVLYIEIARRLGRKFHGIGLPGHFIVGCDEQDFQAYIDPFHGGTVLAEEDCYDLAREATGLSLSDDVSMLMPVSARHIAIRMLNNLRAVYLRRHNPDKAIKVLDLLIDAMPESGEQYKQRAICFVQVDRLAEASADFRKYLRFLPRASDRQEIIAQLNRLDRIIALQH